MCGDKSLMVRFLLFLGQLSGLFQCFFNVHRSTSLETAANDSTAIGLIIISLNISLDEMVQFAKKMS